MKTVKDTPHAVRIEENVWIPMRDGMHLAARLWLPAEPPAAGVPAILESIPYRKRDIKRIRDARIHGYFAAHGYACVRVDARGSGDSEGVLTGEYTEQELCDGEDVLAWIAVQPWCNGRVGMIGISWGGFHALQLAARCPPALHALVTVCASDDRYRDDVHYMGGCLLSDNHSWASTMFAYSSLPPDPAIVGDRWRELWHQRLEGSGLWLTEWLRHAHRDDYWRHGSVCEDYSAIGCPVMAVSGWADGYSNAVFRLVEHLEVPCKGLIGPWSHLYPHLGQPGPAIGFLQECLRWWDEWLGSGETGIMEEPRLRVWLQDGVEPQAAAYRYRPGRWVAEPRWPSPNVRFAPWALDAHRRIVAAEAVDAPPEEGPLSLQSPLSVGLLAGKWCSFGSAPDHPYDQREEDGGSLVYDCRPLDTRLEILGAPELEVELAVDQPVAMLAVRLSDIASDGKATRVTYGLLNLCHRDGHRVPAPLEPGKRYRIRVPMNHAAHGFAPGHRLRVSLSTSYWPLAWAPPHPVTLTIWPQTLRLHLPVRAAYPPIDAQLPDFDEAESAPAPAWETLRRGESNWLIERDLGRESTTLHVINDQGRWYIPEVDLCVTMHGEEWYGYQGDDFGSLHSEVRGRRELERGDWRIRTDIRTRITCDADHFHVHATLDAWEGDERVFSRIWRESVPRLLR
jgi:putative CocE/NonD family hydrolase